MTKRSCLYFIILHSDRYKALLEQFSASSYGDHLFCCFILLPLQQKQPVALRRLLWEENPQVLRFLSIPLDKVCMCTVAIKRQSFKTELEFPLVLASVHA